ncbi:hypothetical protein EVG20_g7237 [Dentipellis fragilis]|uniref:D-aminoacyl-tRNA deacylase n=1 Tax=Dentipellis fragilis TaxID=205917 RepID=A0A4Y9YF15_9AGAM|nr:hypothetical protein EVG20_g7237 [Dentipellis fragilis]
MDGRTDDTAADVDILTKKILTLRVFSDAADNMWKASVKDINGEVLCVSQFTLMANTTKGNKPDFHRAMSTEPSRELYASFLQRIGEAYVPERIKDGKFGAMMNGPVTFTLDSRKFEYVEPIITGAMGGKIKGMNKRSAKAASAPATPGDGSLTPQGNSDAVKEQQ